MSVVRFFFLNDVTLQQISMKHLGNGTNRLTEVKDEL